MTLLEKQFIRDICVNPFDDVPRLIYADWLEEQGRREQAEFIRLQISLVNHHKFETGCPLRKRERELWLVGRRKNWLTCYNQYVSPEDCRRGFVTKSVAEFKNWGHRGKAVCRHNPIEEVTIPGVHPLKDEDIYYWVRRNSRIYEFSDTINYCFIPEWLKDLPGNKGKTWSGKIYFDSEENAHRSLSLALVNHSRRQLKMPDLEWREEIT